MHTMPPVLLHQGQDFTIYEYAGNISTEMLFCKCFKFSIEILCAWILLRRSNQHVDDYPVSTMPFHNILLNDSAPGEDIVQLNVLPHEPALYNNNKYRFENTIEAKVEIGDTLQAIALRFHCSVADIKRINKIDKDNEIYARKVIKIPVTVHNVLLDNLPIVHKSGNSSPKKTEDNESGVIRNPLKDSEAMLSEKLIVASVNSSSLDKPTISTVALAGEDSISNTARNSKQKSSAAHKYEDEKPLMTGILDDSTAFPQLHRIKGPSFHAMDWSGSDCDMSWICLFVVILALCFVIPLIYVFYIAEHTHHNATFHH